MNSLEYYGISVDALGLLMLLMLVWLVVRISNVKRSVGETRPSNHGIGEITRVPIRDERTHFPVSRPGITKKELFASVEQAVRRRTDQLEHAQSKRKAVEARDPSELGAIEVLAKATGDEKSTLTSLLSISQESSSGEVLGAILQAGSNSLASALLRSGKNLPYTMVLENCAKRVKIKTLTVSNSELEAAIITKVFSNLLQSMPESKRRALLEEMAAKHGTGITDIATASGAVVAANLSGFGLYVAASTLLGSITGAMGIALPFAAYTGMSTLISWLTGPVGWALLGGWGIKKLTDPKYDKTLPSIVMIGAIRARLISTNFRERELADRELRLARQALLDLKLEVTKIENDFRHCPAEGVIFLEDIPRIIRNEIGR